MFFSRISLKEGAGPSRELEGVLGTTYGLHQAVWQLFADQSVRKRDFLYHLEGGSGTPVVYALSARPPMPRGVLWGVDTKEFAPRLRPGSRLGFLLRANPVRTREGKRHDVVMEEKQSLRTRGAPRAAWPLEADLVQTVASAWLERRSEGLGFRVAVVRADGYRQMEIGKPGQKHPVCISTVEFSGVVEVVDPDLFLQRALCEGIGPAKGFGCGLMLVRRL